MHPVRDGIGRGLLCRMLRTKAMFTVGHDGAPPPGVDAAMFWCNGTGWALGPDSIPANADRCVPGRGCFETEVEV